MAKLEAKKDNFTRVGLAVVDEVQDAVRGVIDSKILMPLEDFFNKHKHRIYHQYSTKCHFQCKKNTKSIYFKDSPFLTKSQMESVYEKSKKHPQEKKLSFCCSNAIPGIKSTDFDLSFLNAIFKIFPEIIYWPSCLSDQNKSFQDLLNDNKHKLYHLYDQKPCCYCPSGNQLGTAKFTIKKMEFENLFAKQGSVSCKNTGSTGQCICLFSAKNLTKESQDERMTSKILQTCCPLEQIMAALVDVRNEVRGHPVNSKMPREKFEKNWEIIEEKVPALLNHGIFDKKKREEAIQEFTQRLKDLKVKPLTEELYRQVMKNLLQQNEVFK